MVHLQQVLSTTLPLLEYCFTSVATLGLTLPLLSTNVLATHSIPPAAMNYLLFGLGDI